MIVAPTADHGQQLASPAGKVIGFFDGKAEFDAFVEAVLAAGYPAAKITSLYGEDGIHLLERLKSHSFFLQIPRIASSSSASKSSHRDTTPLRWRLPTINKPRKSRVWQNLMADTVSVISEPGSASSSRHDRHTIGLPRRLMQPSQRHGAASILRLPKINPAGAQLVVRWKVLG